MIADRVIAYIAVGVALVCATAAGIAWWRMSSLESDLDKCRTANTQLESSIDTQNSAIKALQSAGDEARKRADAAEATAKAITAASQGQVDALQARILSSKQTACAPALAEIRGMLK